MSAISVTVYPNPSENSFNIAVHNVSLNATLKLSIETICGSVIYQTSGYVPDGSGLYTFTWDAGSVGSGIYFYRIRSDNGESYSGKMVKL